MFLSSVTWVISGTYHCVLIFGKNWQAVWQKTRLKNPAVMWLRSTLWMWMWYSCCMDSRSTPKYLIIFAYRHGENTNLSQKNWFAEIQHVTALLLDNNANHCTTMLEMINYKTLYKYCNSSTVLLAGWLEHTRVTIYFAVVPVYFWTTVSKTHG